MENVEELTAQVSRNNFVDLHRMKRHTRYKGEKVADKMLNEKTILFVNLNDIALEWVTG